MQARARFLQAVRPDTSAQFARPLPPRAERWPTQDFVCSRRRTRCRSFRLIAYLSWLPVRDQKLLSFLRRDLQSHLAALAPNHYLDLFVRPQFAERVGVIVDVFDRRLAELDNYVAGLQTGAFAGRAGPHAVQL